jgi:hypothetical protein
MKLMTIYQNSMDTLEARFALELDGKWSEGHLSVKCMKAKGQCKNKSVHVSFQHKAML